jgi:hypothetical protein
MDAYGISTGGDHVSLVWKDECYDYRPGWSRIAGAMGVFYGAADIAIHVVLSSGAPVKNNTYRDSLIDRDGDHQQIKVDDFAEIVRVNRPQWLLDYIEGLANAGDKSDGVMERLKKFLAEMAVYAGNKPRLENENGNDLGEITRKPGAGASGSKAGRSGAATDPSTRTVFGKRLATNVAGIPTPRFTNDPSHLEQMRGRAAMYVKEDNSILINPTHFRYVAFLEKIQEEAGPDPEWQGLAKSILDEEYKFQVGKYVISAWLYKDLPDWEPIEWEKALDTGSLTVHLTPPDCLVAARQKFRMKVGSAKKEQTRI